MSINLNDDIQVNAPKHIDAKYMKFSGGVCQPYASVAEANSLVASAYRFQYLTVLCLMNGQPVEYWYQGGTLDVNLLPKSKECYQLNSNGSIPLLNNYLYSKLVIVSANNISSLLIGTTGAASSDLESGATFSAGTPYVLSLGIYGQSTTLYFTNVPATTNITLYKEF